METGDASPHPGDDEFARIVAQVAADPAGSRRALSVELRKDPSSFTRLAIHQLGHEPDCLASTLLALLLSGDRLYLRYLTDPAELTQEEAVNAARLLAASDKRFYVKLSGFAGAWLPRERATRVLHIVERLGAASLMVRWLRRMTGHPVEFVRQKAAMIMCQAGSNPLLVERQLHSEDARVRANAVESLWHVNTTAARVSLERAAQDSHHRVATNALVGLFLKGVPGAIERLIGQTHHSSPDFRMAAAWGLGRTGRPEAWPALDALRHDPVAQVRENALQALEKVPGPKCGIPGAARDSSS
jgi:hypothetical protein